MGIVTAHGFTRRPPPAPETVKPPEAARNLQDGWNRFYLASSIMHPTDDAEGCAAHLEVFERKSRPFVNLRMNSQGIGLEALAQSMRVAREAVGFVERIVEDRETVKENAARRLEAPRHGTLKARKEPCESLLPESLFFLVYPQRAACAT